MPITKYLNFSHFRGWITFATWLAISIIVLSFQISDEINQQRQEFQQESESLYQLVRQRIDQNEAVIGGLNALFDTFPNLSFNDIRGYTREMLARYPHIYTIELQPRVELADVSSFESQMSHKLNHPYKIKDFGFGGERNWHPSEKRPFYYPITFMEPPIDAASPVLGLDVYDDKKFHDAINQTILTGKPTASAPFDLVEEGRGYLIFKAIFNTAPPSSRNDIRYKQANQIVSLLIHTNKFLRPEELPRSNSSMLLYRSDYSRNDANGQIVRIEAAIKPAIFNGILPALTFSKAFQSKAQPFIFESQHNLGWEIIRPLPTLLALISTLAITALIIVIFMQRRTANIASNDAANLLLIEKERALAREEIENQRRQHQSELAHVTRLNTMGEMAAGIAHEINQPLTAILSYNQACIRMLQDDQAHVNDPEILRAMHASAAQSKRAGEIIKRLREFVSKQTKPLGPVNLNHVVNNVLLLAEHELREQQVKVTTNLVKTSSFVWADSVQLEQVVLNLVLNAMEAMKNMPIHKKGLAIKTYVEGDVISLSIQDYGQGMPDEALALLFNPFFTTKSNGMGLGLTISQSIIEGYEGKISATNTADGAIFMFTLPIASDRFQLLHPGNRPS